ncbi:MAG: GNAT family N-acetyltransferase [Flavobacteriaceae bacterium]|nr:GNAT family N-acetyltransferase [Flavobacteriaceae bacterium]
MAFKQVKKHPKRSVKSPIKRNSNSQKTTTLEPTPLTGTSPMKQQRLTRISDPQFNEAWKLYEQAFPIEERRTLTSQKEVLKAPNYHFELLFEKKKQIGFLCWWDFENQRYIEHFAIASQERNKGLGKEILSFFIKRQNTPILLEVELPNSNINKRRIQFYERMGFLLNKHAYKMPPYQEGQPAVALLLMTYPTAITATAVAAFIKTCHPIIYNNME